MKTVHSLLIISMLSCSALVSAQKTAHHNSKNTADCNMDGKKLNKENLPQFIQFGIMSKNHEGFKKKYGTAVRYQNCVISKYLSEKARENNRLVAKNLTEKYGNEWRKDLGFIPYGL